MSHSNKTYYYPYFDYLRIVLAIIVMLFHDGLIKWVHSGDLAVQVFFALSGWLIGGILLKLSVKDLPRFYFNRAFRIWIPYYFALILIIAVSLLRDPITPKWMEIVFYDLSFVYNIFGPPQLAEYAQFMPLQSTANHFWSVNAEEQFYLVAPILLVLAASKFGRTVFAWIGIAIVAWITNIYGSMVFGVLAAVVVHHYGPVHSNRSVRSILIGVTGISFAGIIYGFNYDLLAPIFAIGVVLLLAIKGSQDRLGAFWGGVSYPLYLNHWIGVFMANALLGRFGLRGSVFGHILSNSLNLVIAAVLYCLIDRKIVSMREKWFTHKRGIIATSLAYSLTGIGLLGGWMFTMQRT